MESMFDEVERRHYIIIAIVSFDRVFMSFEPHVSGLDDFLRIGPAARYLGVSVSTLRNWDREGKVIALRHPVNGYRFYHKAELSRLLTNCPENDDANEMKGPEA